MAKPTKKVGSSIRTTPDGVRYVKIGDKRIKIPDNVTSKNLRQFLKSRLKRKKSVKKGSKKSTSKKKNSKRKRHEVKRPSPIAPHQGETMSRSFGGPGFTNITLGNQGSRSPPVDEERIARRVREEMDRRNSSQGTELVIRGKRSDAERELEYIKRHGGAIVQGERDKAKIAERKAHIKELESEILKSEKTYKELVKPTMDIIREREGKLSLSKFLDNKRKEYNIKMLVPE